MPVASTITNQAQWTVENYLPITAVTVCWMGKNSLNELERKMYGDALFTKIHSYSGKFMRAYPTI